MFLGVAVQILVEENIREGKLGTYILTSMLQSSLKGGIREEVIE